MILLFDTTAFLHRAVHVVYHKKARETPEHDRRFLDQAARMIVSVIEPRDQARVIFVRDSKASIRRDTIWSHYKATKKPPPPVLVAQSDFFYESLSTIATVWGIDGYEADDLIAAYAMNPKRVDPVCIVSQDKDLMVLVGLYSTPEGRAMPTTMFYEPAQRRYVSVENYIDKFGVMPLRGYELHALTGDAADDVPGIPRLGVKTGAKLLTAFGSLDGVLGADLEALCQVVKPGIAQSIIDNREQVRRNHRLVSPLPMPEGCQLPEPRVMKTGDLANLFRDTPAFAEAT